MRLVRLRTPWSRWSKGHIFTAMPAGQAQVLVQRGFAEYAEPAKEAPKPAARQILKARRA